MAPASVAPTTGSRFVAPITGEGQSNTMTECRDKDRVIALFPRSAFALVPDDTPDLSVICGPDGSGWYPRLNSIPQWQVEMYALELELQPYDFMHKVSAKELSSVRKLFLGMTDFLHMCVALAGGEYVPYDNVENHHTLKCRAIRIHCLTCGKSPCGDHHAHKQHHKDKTFSQRQNRLAPSALAHIVDKVVRQIRQLEGCINSTFADGSGSVEERMALFKRRKDEAQGCSSRSVRERRHRRWL